MTILSSKRIGPHMPRSRRLLGAVLCLALMGCEPDAPEGPLESRWAGEVDCATGPKLLSLTLAEAPDGRMRGLLGFAPAPGHPGAPSGAFRLEGRREGEAMRLDPRAWVRPAEGLDMARLEARWTATGLEGVLEGLGGCTGFSARRE
jgi:hypothetical protein